MIRLGLASGVLLMIGGPALAAPPRDVAKPKVAAPPPAEHLPEIPGYILLGMGATGLAIVGVASRRRVSGRSVSS